MGKTEYYQLENQYDSLITVVKELAPPGLTGVLGVVEYDGGPDFRLNLGKYRVIDLAPMAKHIAVFMEWRKVFRQPGVYADDPDFHLFEDAFGYLGVNDNWNQPWNVLAETDLSDPYVSIFLESGMRLMVREIHRMHPATQSKGL